MWNIIFLITCLIFMIILVVTFSTKKHIKSNENKIFSKVNWLTLIVVAIELLLQIFAYVFSVEHFLVNIVARLYLISITIWVTNFSFYVFELIAKDILSKRVQLIHFVVLLLFSLFQVIAPIYFVFDESSKYSYGPAVTSLKVVFGIYLTIWAFLLIRGRKNIFKKKFIPIFAIYFLMTINLIAQSIRPELLLVSLTFCVVSYLMYFTIENPDIQMLNEVYKNKELMEQNYEDKYNFLFEITQEAKNPLSNISTVCREIRDTDDTNKMKAGIQVINDLVRQLDFSINNIMNVSTLDVQKLKFVDSKYELSKLCEEMVVRCRSNNKNNIEFKYNYPKEDITLMGDYMKIKQIVYSLLLGSLEKTSEGYVEFKVNTIEKYDVCRIVFSITDSGPGISVDRINEILSVTGELDQKEMQNIEKNDFNVKLCQKVIKLMGGNLMIKSNLGKGTEFKLTIDQRVYHDEDNSILTQYENAISNYKKVLVVSQDNRLISRIKNILYNHNITYSVLLYGPDAVDKIKSGKKYDYILISDEMMEQSGLMTLRGMQATGNFKTPCIVMLNKDKENISEHYVNDGFADWLLIDSLDSELERIINKF